MDNSKPYTVIQVLLKSGRTVKISKDQEKTETDFKEMYNQIKSDWIEFMNDLEHVLSIESTTRQIALIKANEIEGILLS